MPFLHAVRRGGGDDQRNVAEQFRLASISSKKAGGNQRIFSRRLERAQDISAVAASAEANQHVAGFSQRFDLSGEDRVESEIIAGTGEYGGIAQRHGGHRAPV